MSMLVVVGAQWGDEGKGKVVDALAREADVVARYAGGNNAGHTLVYKGQQLVTHLVPSGCRYPGTACVLGAGMVIDPEVFREEVEAIQSQGLLQGGELKVANNAHLILPFHRQLDGLREDASRASRKLGTTRRGVGPSYEAKAARRGIRVRELFMPERLRARLEANADALNPELQRLGGPPIDVDALVQAAAGWAEWLSPMVCDVGALIHSSLKAGRRVLGEGAQGVMLDLDHGTYPYVTSSTTCAGGAAAGLGVGPTRVDDVWGITKAYATRVGEGPFPSRVDGPEGDAIRNAGGEFGATTGRPRDCGWLDLPALSYACRVSGMTALSVTKLDVMAQLDRVRVCVGYANGATAGTADLEEVEPIFEEVPGFGDSAMVAQVQASRRLEDLPAPMRAYLDRIAEVTETPIALASVGPERDQTIFVRSAF